MRPDSVRSHVVAIVAAAGLAVFAGTCLASAPEGGTAPRIALSKVAGGRALALPGQAPFHVTGRPVSSVRAIGVAGTPTVVMLWDERAPGGGLAHHYAISLDGRTTTTVRDTEYVVRLRYRNFDPLAEGEPAVPPALAAGPECRVYLVQFWCTPLESMRQAVAAAGGTVLGFLGDHTHLVRMDAQRVGEVRALPFVRWVGANHPAYRVEEALVPVLSAPELDSDAPVRYSIEVHERGLEQQNAVEQRVVALGGTVQSVNPEGYRMDATMALAALRQVVAMDEVAFVDRWTPPGLDMNLARGPAGSNADDLQSALGFSGQGVRGEVFDSGLRETHNAFQNPPPLIHKANSPDTSHGTSVYGIVFGNGAGNPQGRGMLPDREQGIFSAYIAVSQFGGQLPRHQHTQQLVDPTGPYRAVFQTSSVGNAQVTAYTTISSEVDDYLFLYELLSTQSQSNTGNQLSRPQAWAKNIVSVGGVVHANNTNRADDRWQGASYGPAADGRVKPDLTHFYDQILCTGDLSDISYTPAFGGTSGATPITGGAFGLLFQMWHEGVWEQHGGASTVFESRPRMGAAKALMINSAYQYDWTQGGNNGTLTRDKQGWGMADLKALRQAAARTIVIDETDTIAPLGVNTYNVLVLPDTPALKVTLAYTDRKGPTSATQHRVNDLTLRVTSPDGQRRYWGNVGLAGAVWSAQGGVRNTKDTVENVFLQNPEPGTWKVEVFGDEIIQDTHTETPQLDADYGLAIQGVEIPRALEISIPNGVPELIPPGLATNLDVVITPLTQLPLPSSARLHYRSFAFGPFTAVPLTYLGGVNYRATLPAMPCGSAPEFYLSAQGSAGGTSFDPPTAPYHLYRPIVGTRVTLFEDDFQQHQGWFVENEFVQSGEWERAVPIANGGPGAPTSDADGSGRCYITGNTPNEDVDGGPTTLLSPIFNLSGAGPLTEFSFSRWVYTNDVSGSDNLRVEASEDGGQSWVVVENTIGTGGWIEKRFKVTDHVALTPGFRVRFRIADNPNTSLTEAGLDAFKLTHIVCEACFSDCDGNGALNIQDFICFQTKFALGNPEADCDENGTLNIQDFICFQTRFSLGC